MITWVPSYDAQVDYSLNISIYLIKYSKFTNFMTFVRNLKLNRLKNKVNKGNFIKVGSCLNHFKL